MFWLVSVWVWEGWWAMPGHTWPPADLPAPSAPRCPALLEQATMIEDLKQKLKSARGMIDIH